MGRLGPRGRARGGDDIPALRANGTRLATGAASIACLLGVAAVPMTRADETLQAAGIRVVGIAFLVLVAALVLARPALVPVAAIAVGALYGTQLGIDGEPLDVLAPALAAGLLLSVELAYWSLDERTSWVGEPGDDARRAALVALIGTAAFLLAALLLALVDAVRAKGLALDLVGAAAAAAVLLTVLAVSRAQSSRGS